MKKRYYAIITMVLLCLCIPFVLNRNTDNIYNAAISSETGDFTSYKTAIKSSKPSVVLFYANWCTYCRKFMPKFNSLAKIYGDKYNFVKINIESSDDNKRISNKYEVKSLPTVYIIEPKYRIKRKFLHILMIALRI